VPGLSNTSDWAQYEAGATECRHKLATVRYIRNHVRAGHLVWTRDGAARYYLARVSSSWEYFTTPKGEAADIDIGNVFRCEMRLVETAMVPGKVVACFRPRRAFQRICDESALTASQFIWNELSGREVYPLDASKAADPFALLDSEELEDVVFLYLQVNGWYIVPNSRKRDTMSFEYLAVHPGTSESAYTQVKSGYAPINRDSYASLSHRVFLFQANGIYLGGERPNVECISPSTIRAFLNEARRWLPAAIRLKLEWSERIQNARREASP